MFARRHPAILFTLLFVALALAPLAYASTEPTHNGDVVVNGDFRDGRAVGHPLKANSPQTTFVAFDWTSTASAPTADGIETVGSWTLGEAGGITVEKTAGPGDVGVQQYFNGSFATSRAMRLFGASITASAPVAGTYASLQIRYDDASGARQTASRSIPLTSSPATYRFSAADLGLSSADVSELVSVRILTSGLAKPVAIDSVSVYATNGVEGRNIHILPAGDDVVTSLDGAMLLNPGDDGKYSFLVGMARDTGDFLPTLDASLCLYTAEQAIDDRGYPANAPVMCEDAYLRQDSPAITKTRAGNAFRIDVDASVVDPSASDIPAFAVYATVKVDASYDIETPGASSAEFKSGYLHAARIAADVAGANVSQEYYGATPVLIDADADGTPDAGQLEETDGYSVIVTPQLATASPLLTVITPDMDGLFHFDVQVFRYEGATGAPIPLSGGISLGIFDGSGLANGAPADATPLWKSEGSDISSVDATTLRVSVPLTEVPANTPLGVWAYYAAPGTPVTNVFGRSSGTTDFYSVLRNAVKEHVIADALRTAGTPILLDSASLTRDATLVIRLDPAVDDLTAVDGTIVVGDKGDGTITFEYAMVLPESRTRIPVSGGHGFALYDAAGVVSDDLQPGSRQLAHAEFTDAGALTSDGWFRVDVPVEAFEDAVGPVAAWAYVDDRLADGYLLSRSGYYNLLKGAAASISTSAAEAALYEPTPIVIADTQLGIPATLASTMAGLGTDLVSVTNPIVNPGFALDLFVEGVHDSPSANGGTMTSPPWFLRLDDNGTGQPTRPASTHQVLAGAGRLGDNALEIRYKFADSGKGLMLGQLLGAPEGSDGLVWKGATGVSFDVRSMAAMDIRLKVSLRYLDPADDTIKSASGLAMARRDLSWQRVSLPMTLPADAHLLGLYVQPSAAGNAAFLVDNFVVEGARTSMGDARTDLTDGYAVIIAPQHLVGSAQDRVAGASAEYYLYDVRVMDYTAGTPQTLVVDGLARSFALRTEELQKETGTIMKLRGDVVDRFVAAVPADEVPAAMAAPWAWVDAGEAYSPFGTEFASHPASGHYNPVKNALAGTPFADQLDYAATPVAFTERVAATLAGAQSIRLAPTANGYQVFVAADSPFVETTTLTVSQPGLPAREFPVTLTRVQGDVVPGLELTAAQAANATLRTSSTLFTRGATLVAGSPAPSFEVCRPDQPGCLSTGILSREVLTFRSTSASPTGEPLTLVWNFGDGTTPVTTASAETTHAFARPGSYTVNLTAQTPSGRSASVLQTVTVANRAPTIAGIDISPATIYTDSSVQARGRAADLDGGSLTYAWKIDGIDVPGIRGNLLPLTASILENTTGNALLQERAYEVALSVSDGQGGLTSAVTSFTVNDRPTVIAPLAVSVLDQPNATYALPGESLLVRTTIADADDAIVGVDVEVTSPVAGGTFLVPLTADAGGNFTGVVPVTEVGAYTLRVLATVEGAAAPAAGALRTYESRADTPPVVTLVGSDTGDVGATSAYTVSAVDPDGRGVLFVDLQAENASVQSAGDGVYLVSFSQMGLVTLTAKAEDVTGAAAETGRVVIVDDAILVTLELISRPKTATQGYIVRVTVTDVMGTPMPGMLVRLEDYYEPLPAPLRTESVTTGQDGTRDFRVDPEARLVGLPLAHRLVATVTGPSHADAPVQDEETGSDELSFRNEAEPFAGLPLA